MVVVGSRRVVELVGIGRLEAVAVGGIKLAGKGSGRDEVG